MPWKRERLPTPVFCPREFYGLYSPWGVKESERTEGLSLSESADGDASMKLKDAYSLEGKL